MCLSSIAKFDYPVHSVTAYKLFAVTKDGKFVSPFQQSESIAYKPGFNTYIKSGDNNHKGFYSFVDGMQTRDVLEHTKGNWSVKYGMLFCVLPVMANEVTHFGKLSFVTSIISEQICLMDSHMKNALYDLKREHPEYFKEDVE